MAGQLRVDVGVAGAVDEPAGGRGELVALQPVAHRLHQGEQAEQHREVGLHLRRDPVARRAHPDAAVEVVGDGGDDEHDEQRREQPPDEEGEERQPEHVEADVGVELRVLDPEVAGVGEEDPRVPLARHAGAGDQGEQPRQRRRGRGRPGRATSSWYRSITSSSGPAGRNGGASRSAITRLIHMITKKAAVKIADRAILAPSTPRQIADSPERVVPEVVRVEARRCPAAR